MRSVIASLAFVVLSAASHAHHSFSAVFDGGQVIEIEGEVTRVVWANPHVRFSVQSGDETWEIETHSVSILARMQIFRDLMPVGETVKLAGNPSRQPDKELFALHALLPGGEEVVFDPQGKPRWGSERVGSNRYWVAPDADTLNASKGIFRVWSTVAGDPASFPLFPEGFDPTFDIESYPLTDSARRALAAFNPVTDAPTLNCAPKGMPTIMEQPYPMEFVDQGADIALRIEEYDTVRTIHLGGTSSADEPRALLGHSVGRWEGTTLVVTTTRMDWPHFDTVGIPLSEAAEVVEWFTPSDDGSRLNYRIRVTDPATFSEPVEHEKYWLAVARIEVQPYACTK